MIVFEDPAETGEVAETSGLARGRWAVHDDDCCVFWKWLLNFGRMGSLRGWLTSIAD